MSVHIIDTNITRDKTTQGEHQVVSACYGIQSETHIKF